MSEEIKAGKVTLLGAGPGDLDLLTRKAVKALALADILLLDDLVNQEIALLAPNARTIHVGKRGGCKSTPQDFIQRLARRYALQGKHVVRVKGGEALVFGRAGEEIAYLRRAGINIELCNGISSGLAAAASLGISLTHRAYAQGVTLVTAHTQGDLEPDWSALAATKTTLVIYMGMSRVSQIATGLLKTLDEDTPVAVVQAASSINERRLLTSLGRLIMDVAAADLGSPAIILVGNAICEADEWRDSNITLAA
ncbi:uroporphyrinogen-III C-methyltransferase [Glaciimonas soli]|uniref:uroporphyrinogen-III C-methyltransferase n=1 Tax=Glaciimonas soli TaxID=2590999 RepID=A0A843YND8_9BURK|nr:uroporphyrinogen-III C-methyltransferase [Glaciimonas soli]MQQ99293.1 uroporphyrinogen-III C-methyltransferase [Glaciimonas soli]